MKILLVGEYSRLHNSLKEGLEVVGHQVKIVGTGDDFKKYNVDFSIHPKFCREIWLVKKFKNLVYRLTNIDLEKTEKGLRFYFLLPKLKGFDHIQLINSDALETHPNFEIFLYKKLFRNNFTATKSLLVCGDETPVVDYLLKEELEYSILTPFLRDKSLKKSFKFTLKYTQKNYRKLFHWVHKNTHSLIVSDLDYKIPMERMGYAFDFIPNPINSDKIEFHDLQISDKIVIFLGINRMNYVKKGIAYFEEALAIIQEKYAEKIEVIVSENLPYAEYIKSYNKAHIVLDMTYAFDQGYNALEAMAKGKVVFTGASPEFEKQFDLSEKVAINAVPNAVEISKELSSLIENPQEIIAIGKRARNFIEREHELNLITAKYLEIWKNKKNAIA
ncbi:glycosyltransferase [uncultured Flavobacterium sp.]|uniref:glycosyltransferase family protein n=1 Tax=uncultured Flavobacterium sp. TaxID=165435 RepID=UPI0025D16CDB|nr:glycosyltransferase [uncultured Flavobacterium sp.]